MRKLYSVFAVLVVLFACSKEEEVITPPAPNKYTITITAEAGGSVSSPGGTYNEGSKITITATPDGQYLFEKWSDGSTVNPREITVTANLTLSATFVKKTYPLSVTVEGEGTVQEEVIIQGSTSETTYNAGTTVRLTATPNEGWVFAGWSGDIESEEKVIEVAIEKGTSVNALFKRSSFELNITIVGEGTVTEEVIVQPSQYDYETVVRLTAVPAEGWEFDGWSGDIESTDNPLETTINVDLEVTVRFNKTPFITSFVDKPTVFLPFVNGYSSNEPNLQQYKQPIWNWGNYVFNEQELIGSNDWAVGSDYLVGDWNLDGYNDIFMSSMTGEERENVPFQMWLYDDIEKTLINKSNLITDNLGQSFSRKALTSDFNGDGVPDFVSVSHPERPHKEFSYLDVVLSEGQNWRQITLSKLSRNIENSPESGYYHGVDVGDVDNDGDIDILAAMWHNGDKGMTLFRNDGSGVFNEENNIVKILNDEESWKETMSFTSDLIDINNDGCLDLAIGWSPTLIKYGNCDGTFGPDYMGNFFAGNHGGILSYDIDLDGDNDLIFRAETPESGSVQIYLNSNNAYTLHNEYEHWMGEPFDIKDINLDGEMDIIGRDPFRQFADPTVQDAPVGQWQYSKDTFLMGKGNLEFEVVEVPPITLVQNITYNNNTQALEWSFAFLPKGNDVIPAESPHLLNLRGGIDEWYIYFKEAPFYFIDENIEVTTIKGEDLPGEMINNNSFKVSYDNNLKEGYYRIGYKDLLGIIYPPSYEVRLSSN